MKFININFNRVFSRFVLPMVFWNVLYKIGYASSVCSSAIFSDFTKQPFVLALLFSKDDLSLL